MATSGTIGRLGQIIKQLEGVDKDKLLRPNLGEESLKEELQGRLLQIDQMKDLALKHGAAVADETVNQVSNIFGQIFNLFNTQAAQNNPQYISNRPGFLQQTDQNLEGLKKFRPFFVVAAMEEKGLLESQDIQEINKRSVEQIKAEAQQALAKLSSESNRVLENAKQLAKEIEEGARRTATGVSVKEAQEQFANVQKDINRQVVLWSILSALSLLAFLISIYYLAHHQHLPDQWTWQILYYTTIRVTFLSALGAVAGYCFSLLRIYIQLRQRNKHRQCIANSIEAFVNSALSKEQRDAIFASLVQSIISYGEANYPSDGNDSIFSSHAPIDAIAKMTSATMAISKKSN